MDDEIIAPPEFKDGFNKGYVVAKYYPDALKGMPELSNNSFNRGFGAGIKEWEAEKAKDYFKSFGSSDNSKDKDKDIKR